MFWIAGATGTGKSAVAHCLAELIHGEVISVDSMQIYRGLDLGTAKPSADEMRRVPHHLVNIRDVTEPFDVVEFQMEVHRVLAELGRRRRTPVFCGGTGFYFKALLEGVGTGPPANSELRRQLETQTTEALLAELQEADPTAVARMDRHNRRRVVRAVEVVRLSGRPASSQQAKWSGQAGADVPRFFALSRRPEDLRARLESRVERMFAEGLVEETRRLLDAGLESNPVAMQAIGYRQVVDYLRGRCDLQETIGRVKQRTWQLARRQNTWLRRQLAPVWVPVDSAELPLDTARRLLELPARLNHNPAPPPPVPGPVSQS
jgi:tRNA dimethylallyltransferase